MTQVNVFEPIPNEQMHFLYAEIMRGKENGLRPRCLDCYIKQVGKKYRMDFGEAWRYTEQLFFEEVARRYFAKDRKEEGKRDDL